MRYWCTLARKEHDVARRLKDLELALVHGSRHTLDDAAPDRVQQLRRRVHVRVEVDLGLRFGPRQVRDLAIGRIDDAAGFLAWCAAALSIQASAAPRPGGSSAYLQCCRSRRDGAARRPGSAAARPPCVPACTRPPRRAPDPRQAIAWTRKQLRRSPQRRRYRQAASSSRTSSSACRGSRRVTPTIDHTSVVIRRRQRCRPDRSRRASRSSNRRTTHGHSRRCRGNGRWPSGSAAETRRTVRSSDRNV